MKILWIKTDFLHPTERGGQIRTLEMVRRLHRRHEVHYVALENRNQPEGLARAGEYSSQAYPIPHVVPARGTAAFGMQLLGSLGSPLPLSVSRYRSAAMARELSELPKRHRFDRVVCDFVFPAQNVPFLSQAVLFQHNVETLIWRRHAETATGLKKKYFELQAKRMFRYEERICRAVRHIVTVSDADAELTGKLFGLRDKVSVVPTGVDCDYFARPERVEPFCDFIFVGAMDWMPNIDGVRYFVKNVWPQVRAAHPGCTLGIVGRSPGAEIQRLEDAGTGVRVTGTVPDVRPYLWGSRASIVPLRIGGGTRLKIYESMAAGVPVISTSIGAEGLPVRHGETIRIADEAGDFAGACVRMLAGEGAGLGGAAQEWVREHYSWESVVDHFEEILSRDAV